MDLKTKKVMVVVMSVFFLGTLILVAAHESGMTRPVGEPKVYIGDSSSHCIECHTRQDVAVGVISQWKSSKHAQTGVGCLECHKAEKGDFDAFTCPSGTILVGQHPTPKDCSTCHADQVKEHKESKHGLAQLVYTKLGADRNLLEPAIGTKNGCDECHNIGNYWPDGSIGECDACHSKHSFSLAVARNPYTCGECHIGPDHPHIEQYLESKHGNIHTANLKSLDLNYVSSDKDPISIEAPVCTTCHMDAVPGQKSTHNVSKRLSWEMQAPFSFRVVWNDADWKQNRQRMTAVCNNCHSKSFYETYLLTADLVQLQYNEMYKSTKSWIKLMEDNNALSPLLDKDQKRITKLGLNGYDQEAEEIAYHFWHHEGRRFRMGAMMMSPDYTQWHGIWELQHDLINIINSAAEHGVKEAVAWQKVASPAKFYPFPLFDIAGSAWGISTIGYRTPWTYKNVEDYWGKVKKNVEAAYNHGLLSKDQWALWMKMFENKDHYLGLKYDHPPYHKEMVKMMVKDKAALKSQVLDFNPPVKGVYEINK